jgi:GNAT superfamily N-acetyltransferase
MDEIKDLTIIRSYTDSDKNFIVNSWLHGFKQGCEYFRLIDKEAYFDYYGKVINLVLERPNVDIKLICLAEDPEIILGYSIAELRPAMMILHWIYVKPDWRNNDLGTMLAPERINVVTHLTKIGRAILKKHPEIKFNPFIL